MPIQLSLFKMESFGFPANEDSMRTLHQTLVGSMKKLEREIYKTNGSKFNLGSSTVVAKVLGLQRRADGKYCTSKQILEKIDSPISNMIMTYRKMGAALSNTIQPFLKVIQSDKIYCQSNTFTATGRISMHEPNIQNTAKNFEVKISEEYQKISCRSVFFPKSDRYLISSDFCQLEMRILAHLSQDKQLIKSMNSNQDIFTAIAAKWNKITEEEVSEDVRNGTKQICYGVIYGMGIRSLADNLKCSEQEASMIIEQFHIAYPGIRLYIEKVIKFAKSCGYVETITGRRRYLEYINSGEPQRRSSAERQAVNSTIQGSAADIVKNAILKVENNMFKYIERIGCSESDINFILHLHDELIYEVPNDKVKKIAKLIRLTMENCVKLNVPLKVKIKIGKSWGYLQEVKI